MVVVVVVGCCVWRWLLRWGIEVLIFDFVDVICFEC